MDYSKWDKFGDISDSDEEVHPNIDKKSFHKWKHDADMQERQSNLERIERLRNKGSLTADSEKELHQCLEKEARYRIRFDELKEKFSHSTINKPQQVIEAQKIEEDEDKYIKEMEMKAQVFVKLLGSYTQARDHLRNFPEIISDNTETYYLLHFRDRVKENDIEVSKLFSKASLIIKYMLQLSGSARQLFFEKLINDAAARKEFEAAAAEYWQDQTARLKELWQNHPPDSQASD